MDYRNLLQEENEAVRERYVLAAERIRQIAGEQECDVVEPYRTYFQRTSAFLVQMQKLLQDNDKHRFDGMTLEELQAYNRALYADILPENYGNSYANPVYAVQTLGEEYGPLLSFLYTELRGEIVYAYEYRLTDLTILDELFIEVYNCFEQPVLPTGKELKETLYWFVSDYSDVTVEWRTREQVDPDLSFAVDIIEKADLSDLRYLYRFGEYITENELETARFLNTLPQEEIDAMASTYTEGYRIGFVRAGKDLAIKKTVNIRYTLGFERIVKQAIANFRAMGLEPVLYRAAVNSINKKQQMKIGYFGGAANKQYEYDHKDDCAIYLDKPFVERKLGVLKVSYEKYKELAKGHAGPAVMEVFGEQPFVPENRPEAFALSEKQQKLSVQLASEAGRLTNTYIPGEERSFTIIAYPVPEIGPDYAEIFRETVKVNTLDYRQYERIQQTMIDALNEAVYMRVLGTNGNRTDIRVSLYPLRDPSREAIFENCVADVNIPVGEIFTSPVLAGTEGILHVRQVYLNELNYENLELHFTDGRVTDYTCSNFEKEEDNRKYIQDNVLFHHDTLPLGEFAIGTNTTAYRMMKTYQIGAKMPILIAEKTGPHFAVGDTCYSWEEDVKVYNPDGKEIVARENEISACRKEDPGKAYFNCHTDITIPYEELGELYGVRADGSKIVIISNGKFVLPGTEELNRALEK